MRTWCYLIGLAQFPICNFLYSQFPIPALFWPCCGMRLFTELGFSKFNLRKVFPLNSLFKFLLNGSMIIRTFHNAHTSSGKVFFCFFATQHFSQKLVNILNIPSIFYSFLDNITQRDFHFSHCFWMRSFQKLQSKIQIISQRKES